MLWYALAAGLILGSSTFLFTRNLKKSLRFGGFAFLVGIILALLIVYSGLMGG